MLREKIISAIIDVTGEREVHLEYPENEAYGDYSTNIAMQLASKQKDKKTKKLKNKAPRKLAEEIVQLLQANKELMRFMEKIEVAGPGFINFWLAKEVLVLELQNVVKNGDKYGSSNVGKGKKVIVEYSSPNIAKYFGIGHLRSTIIGQALYSLYKFLGYKVIGDNHIGDWGTQFGMIIAQVERKNLEASKLSVGDFEKLYIEFNERLQNEPKLREVAKDAFKRLESGDKTAREIWKEAKKTSEDEFERIYKRLGVKFDNAYGESFYKDKMQDVIDELRKKKLTKKSKGAEIVEFPNLSPAMLLKSDGATTYYTRDLATVKFRMDRFKPQIVIYEVGSEQKLHFKQVFATAELMGWLNGTELVHVAHGLIRFEHGKMTTRRGETVKLEEVLNEAIRRAYEVAKSETINVKYASKLAIKTHTGRFRPGQVKSKTEAQKIAQQVGIGAIKYFDLMHHPVSDIIFDWEKMFVLEGNSAPYLQYTYARTQSVLAKLKTQNSKLKTINLNMEEMMVLRSLPKFQEIIIQSARNYSPNLLCNYLFDLAQKYNTFYARHRILDLKKHRSPNTSEFRLALTTAVGQILKNGLKLLGIKTPERM